MKTKIFSLIAALLLFLPLSKAQSGGYNYEGNKQSLVLRAMNNYFSFFLANRSYTRYYERYE